MTEQQILKAYEKYRLSIKFYDVTCYTDFKAGYLTLLNRLEEVIAERDDMLAALGTQAAKDVIKERQRQTGAEGWTQEHDDRHNKGQMAAAAGVYALHSGGYNMQMVDGVPSAYWPWAPEWWKPADARRNLVKAAALIIAEIERLDRATVAGVEGQTERRRDECLVCGSLQANVKGS
jgi:hypothetical protein